MILIDISDMYTNGKNCFDKNLEYCDHFDLDEWLNEQPIINPEELPIVKELIEKLEQYKQAEKDGRLIELPCKVGDTINTFEWTKEKGLHIISDMVTSITINKFGYTIKTKSKFYPIKEKDGYTFAPISEYPYAFADYYVGGIEDANKKLVKQTKE